MSHYEGGGRASPDESPLEPKGSKIEAHDDLKSKAVELLKTKGFYDDSTKNAMNEWMESKGLDKILEDHDVDQYVKLFTEKAKMLADAKFTEPALAILYEVLLNAKEEHHPDVEKIINEIENIKQTNP